jgi:hypothetical protein
LEVFVHVVGVAACVGFVVDIGFEGVVEWEQTLMVVGKLDNWCLLGEGVKGGARIVNHSGLKIIVLFVLLVKHGIRDIWDVVSISQSTRCTIKT